MNIEEVEAARTPINNPSFGDGENRVLSLSAVFFENLDTFTETTRDLCCMPASLGKVDLYRRESAIAKPKPHGDPHGDTIYRTPLLFKPVLDKIRFGGLQSP